MDDRDYLTTGPTARELKVSESRVRQLELAGRLPAIRTDSGVRLFRRKDVETLKRAREAAAVR
jgi:DNA-binding transcriptional MerR regulator